MPLTFTKCYGEETMIRTLFVHGVKTDTASVNYTILPKCGVTSQISTGLELFSNIFL
jgi:hypothetical protein